MLAEEGRMVAEDHHDRFRIVGQDGLEMRQQRVGFVPDRADIGRNLAGRGPRFDDLGIALVEVVEPVALKGHHVAEQRPPVVAGPLLAGDLAEQRRIRQERSDEVVEREIGCRPVCLEAGATIGVGAVPEGRRVRMCRDRAIAEPGEDLRQARRIIGEFALELDRTFGHREAAQELELGIGGLPAEGRAQCRCAAAPLPQCAQRRPERILFDAGFGQQGGIPEGFLDDHVDVARPERRCGGVDR